jgi:hypothetical protein
MTVSTISVTERPPRALLVLEDDRSRTIPLPEEGALVVGRGADASIVVGGRTLSRRHARFILLRGKAYVEDLGSRNGTSIGGVAIAPHVAFPLRDGVVVDCGGVVLVLRSAPSRCATSVAVSEDGRWFRRGDDEIIQLGRRGALRLLLVALVERRLASPGAALDVDAMFSAGWPGERIARESAQARVYTSVQRLRGLGLDGILLTRGDGYLLDPEVVVRRG